jgi:hypothetical protein
MDAVIDRSRIGALGAKIGSGGQATVYLAPGLRLHDAPGDLVYKEYRAGSRPPLGLVSIAAKRARMLPDERARLDQSATWPLRVVRDGNVDCGVILSLIPDGFFQTRTLLGSGRVSRDLREVQNLFVDPAVAAKVGMPCPDPTQRLLICRDFASALHFLHRRDMCVGDINARNAVFRTDGGRPSVMLVDCDAVRIRGAAPVVAQLNAPDWDPPEGRDTLTQTTDRYKFGLFVLRCLAPGPMASTGRDPSRAASVLDAPGRALLVRALDDAGARRPTIQEWGQYLEQRLTGRVQLGSAARRGAAEPHRPSPMSTKQVPAPRTTTQARRRNKVTGKWEPVP